MSRSTALVTGASSGIGRELAKILAGEGHDLVLVARRRDRLEELARELSVRHGISARAIAKDLADPASCEEIVADLESDKISVDVLVNNAGSGVYGPFWRTDLARQLAILQINAAALTELTGRILPGMVSRRRGRIVNVASTAAFQPGPLMAVYYASKAYVLSFSEALAAELEGSGVSVTAFCPGPVITEFQEKAGLSESRLFASPLVMDAERVARIGWAAAKKGRRVVIPGLGNRLLARVARLAPRRMVTAVAARLQKGRSGETT